jgi:hypothetical protein
MRGSQVCVCVCVCVCVAASACEECAHARMPCTQALRQALPHSLAARHPLGACAPPKHGCAQSPLPARPACGQAASGWMHMA